MTWTSSLNFRSQSVFRRKTPSRSKELKDTTVFASLFLALAAVSLLSTNLETGTGKIELNPRTMLGEHEKKLTNRESEATC